MDTLGIDLALNIAKDSRRFALALWRRIRNCSRSIYWGLGLQQHWVTQASPSSLRPHANRTRRLARLQRRQNQLPGKSPRNLQRTRKIRLRTQRTRSLPVQILNQVLVPEFPPV